MRTSIPILRPPALLAAILVAAGACSRTEEPAGRAAPAERPVLRVERAALEPGEEDLVEAVTEFYRALDGALGAIPGPGRDPGLEPAAVGALLGSHLQPLLPRVTSLADRYEALGLERRVLVHRTAYERNRERLEALAPRASDWADTFRGP